MAREWATATIEELQADVPHAIAMGPFGSNIRTENFVDVGVPVIRGGNLSGTRLIEEGFVFLTEQKADELRASVALKGDIVITHRGTLGQVGIIPDDARFPRYVVSQSQLKITINRAKADPIFVFYFLRSDAGQHQLLANTAQTGVPAIASPTKAVKGIRVPLPPLAEQRAIASILGTLDDKIELNRRMNETLEAMARAIFKSWFVDFDPVRAKTEGRDTGLPPEIDALFPDGFEDSELGEIPRAWQVGVLGEVADHPRRGVHPGEIEATTPYIALEHMPRRSIALSEWETAKGLQSGKFRFSRGDVLFGKLRPYFHKVGVAPVDGVCSTDIVVITSRIVDWFGFVLGHVSSDAFVQYTDAGSTGTKMPRTSWTNMARYPVVLPPKRLAAVFTDVTRPMIERILASIHESRTLAAVRDALLPKLMSGELRVKDAERLVGAV